MGREVPTPEAMRHIGFLPENPYVYPYLTPREFVTMCGRLSGMGGRSLAAQTERVLDRVGILYAADRPVQRLSKGMLQRVGLASTLVHKPRFLILDEPLSGLDPIGRHDVKELLLEFNRQGGTIFLNSHILADIGSLCHRVGILHRGRLLFTGTIEELLRTAGKTSLEEAFLAVVRRSEDD